MIIDVDVSDNGELHKLRVIIRYCKRWMCGQQQNSNDGHKIVFGDISFGHESLVPTSWDCDTRTADIDWRAPAGRGRRAGGIESSTPRTGSPNWLYFVRLYRRYSSSVCFVFWFISFLFSPSFYIFYPISIFHPPPLLSLSPPHVLYYGYRCLSHTIRHQQLL
jgi:hypothetical protein